MTVETQTNIWKGIALAGAVALLAMLSVMAGQFRSAGGPHAEGLGVSIALLMAIALSLAFYFLPTVIAVNRRHHQIGPIAIVNIFLGWTFIGWVVAFAMSLSAVKK